MLADVREFNNAINKISDLTSGDKVVPGVLLNLQDMGGTGRLKICYSSGRKFSAEEIDVNIEEGDVIGSVVTNYEQLKRAVSNCLANGEIVVDNFRIEYLDSILRVSIQQYYEYKDDLGDIISRKNMGSKYMDIERVDPSKNIKASVLIKTNYDNIFEVEDTDEYNRVELIDILNRTTTEKGKVIYFAAKRQEVFVINQAYASVCPITPMAVDQFMEDEVEKELIEQGITDKNLIREIKAEKFKRIKYSLVMNQQIAKALAGILSKSEEENVYVGRIDDKFCNVYVDTETEKFGVVFEMPQASKVHIDSIDKYSTMEYKTYQISFLRVFLEDTIKSALSSSKSDITTMYFEEVEEDENGWPVYELVLQGGSASASTYDILRTNADDLIDSVGNITDVKFSISLKVFSDMLSQLKTARVALDFNINDNGLICIRMAEINDEITEEEYLKAREDLDDETPTPVERKLEYRIRTLGARQFAMLPRRE